MKKCIAIMLVAVFFVFSVCAEAEFQPIMKGSKGDGVKAIQRRLIDLGMMNGKADGDFGNGTENAIKQFQTDNGMEPTGIIDKATYDALYEGVEGLITFRDFDWYVTKEEFEEKLYEEGASSHGALGNPNNIYRLSATNSSSITFGSDRVDEGGYRGWYADVSVAGYQVDDTYACFVYPIVDGEIIRDDDKAEFYFGWYTFKKGDYEDIQSIYDDLSNKLASIYGEGNMNSDRYYTTITWTDVQGNFIRLLINKNQDYATLGYMAANAESMLNDMDKAISNEAALAEAKAREENASNTSGL